MNKISHYLTISKKNFESVGGFLFLFIKKYWKLCCILIGGCSISLFLSGILASSYLEEIIDCVQMKKFTFSNQGSLYWLVLFISCHAISEILTFVGKIMYARLPIIELEIRMILFNYLHKISLNYFNNDDHGSVENTIDNAAEGSRETLEDLLTEIIPSILFTISTSIYLYILNNTIGGIYSVMLVIYFMIYFVLYKSVLKLGKKAFEAVNNRTGVTIELIENFKLSKIFQINKYFSSKLFNASDTEKELITNYFYKNALFGMLCGLFIILSNLILIYLIITRFRETMDLSPGKIGNIINLLFITSWTLWGASKQIMDMLLNISRVNQSIEKLSLSPLSKIKGVKKNIKFGDIVINNLNYTLGSNQIFKNFSLKIPKGSKVCIMGPSGYGKTTLLNILAKINEINDDQVFINGIDINSIEPEYFKNHLSYITQSNYMFHSSIMDNIKVGRDISDQNVINICKKLKIHDFIMSLPKQYESDVGVSSGFLSGGQIQRISIARGLLNNGDLIVCDEPTSAIDTITSIAIIDNIIELSKDKTLIWVDHSVLVSPYMDMIIMFNLDRTISVGTHTELLKHNVDYQKMFRFKKG